METKVDIWFEYDLTLRGHLKLTFECGKWWNSNGVYFRFDKQKIELLHNNVSIVSTAEKRFMPVSNLIQSSTLTDIKCEGWRERNVAVNFHFINDPV